ncbi:MAG TPA: MlaD family protein [Acetobacteraceae bacterium]|nr:MlaD family protein [Acetobacteraceae bacterium]
MEGRGAYLRVGLLLLGGLVLLVGLVLFLSGGTFGQTAKYETYFAESVQGLDIGAPVKFRGVTIGRVTGIGLVNAVYGRNAPVDVRKATYRLVFVRFEIDTKRIGQVPDTQTAIKTGLRARLASQGITGISYLELDFVKPGKYPPLTVPWQPKYEYIPSMPSTFTQVQDAAQQLLARLDKVNIDGLVNTLATVADDVHTELKTGDIHRVLADADTLVKDLDASVKGADLPGLSAEISHGMASLRTMATGPQTKNLLAQITAAANRLSVAAGKLPALIAAMQATVQRANGTTADLQQQIDPLLRDARAAAANLRDTTDALRRYPGGVLFGGPPPHEMNHGR